MPVLSLLIAVHVIAAIVWVGGMAFAYGVLRHAAGGLEPSDRLGLWRRVFARFFPWVWIAIVALLVTGYAMVFLYLGGFAGAGLHVHLMQGTGIVMMLLFGHLYFAPWRRFRQAVDGGALADAAKNLDMIRKIVGINLVLGLLTVVIGAGGGYL